MGPPTPTRIQSGAATQRQRLSEEDGRQVRAEIPVGRLFTTQAPIMRIVRQKEQEIEKCIRTRAVIASADEGVVPRWRWR